MKRTYSLLFSQFIRAQKLLVACLLIGLTIPTTSSSQLMINEFSPDGNEFIEMVVVGAPCELVNIQGIIIDDNNGDFVNCPTPQALSGIGIATGFIRFTFDPLWAAIPAGTIITLGGPGTLDTDVCDYAINIPASSTPGYFEQATAGTGMPLTPVGSNTPADPCFSRDCVLNNGNPNYSVGNPYGFIIGDAFGGAIRLRNDGDACQLRTPTGAYLHGLGYGTADNNGCPFTVQITGGPDGLLLPTAAQFSFFNAIDDDFRNVANWTSLPATPGQANNCNNAEWIASMRAPQEDQIQGGGGTCNTMEPTTLLLCGPETLTLTGCLSDNFSWASDDPSIATFSGPTNGSSVTVIPAPGNTGGMTNIVVTITLDNTNLGGGCPAPSTTTYTYPVNISSFTPDATSVDICQNETCYNPYSDNNTIYSGGGVTFTWYNGDPNTGGTILPNPSCLDFSSPPEPNLFVTLSDGSCSSTFPITANLIGPPTVTIPPVLPTLCSNIPFFNLTIFNAIINSDPNAIIQWYNGNPNTGGSIISLPNFATPADLSNLWVRVTVNGCISDPVMIPLMFNDPPTVTASSDVTSICAGGIINLMASTTDATGVTWDNNGGDGNFDDINSPNATYTPGPLDISNGSFTLTVTTTNSSNCPNTSDNVVITVSAGPTAMITGQNQICSDGSATLNAGSTDPTNSILWTTVVPSDGSFSFNNNNNTVYTPGANDIANGSATVMVSVSDATGLCQASTDMFNITILPSPTAMIDVPNPVICEGEQIFVSVISPSASNGVFWNTNGDGSFDDNFSASTFYTPGSLDGTNGTVRLAVTISSGNNCPPANDFIDITVIPAPEIFADGPPSVCGETVINLLSFPDGSASGTSWSANPGDGTFSDPDVQNPTYTPGPGDILSGSVTFTVTTSDPTGNCMDVSDTHTTILEAGATVMAGGDQIICEGNTVMLNAILSDPINNTITWTTSGDGSFNLNNVSNPIYTPGAIDILNGSVLLTATTQGSNPNCPVGTDEVDVTITPAPTVMVGNDITICEGSIANLTATIGGSATAFTWSTNGDGDFSSLTDPNATYNPGPNDIINQSVTITATTDNPNVNCTPGTGTIDITITEGPEVSLGNDLTICQTDVVNLSAMLEAPATSLTWSSSGDGTFSSLTDPNATYTPGVNDQANIATNIILTATTDDVNGSCNPGTAMLTVTLDEVPSIDLGNDLTSCGNDDVDLTASLGGSASTVFWTTDGDGTFDDDGSTTPTYSPGPNDVLDGSVMLTAVTDNGGGSCNPVSDDITITFSTTGDASFSFPAIGCTNGSNPIPDVSPTSSGSFSVNNSGDINATTGEFLISSAVLGETYTITFTSTGNCPGDFTQDIMIVGPDDPSFTFPTISCSDGTNPTPSTNPTSPGNFTVNNGATIDPVTGELDLSTVTAGNTYLISFLTTGNCPATSASNISILAPPDAGNPSAPITTCNSGSAVIDLNTLLTGADAGGTWTDVSVTPTDGFNVDQFDPTNQAGDTYTFRYTLPANAGCPEDFSEVSITVEAQETAILDQTMLMPCSDNNASNISTVNLNDLILSTSVPGTWADTDGTGVDLTDLTNVDFDGIAPGFYTFTYSLPATANCPQAPTYPIEIEVVSCACPAVQNTVIASTCEGIPFIWNSIPYTMTDTYIQTYPFAAASGCDSSDVIVLTVIPLPTIDVGGNFIICEGDEIDLSATIGGSADGITWSTPGDGSFDNANIINPTYTPGANDILNGSVTFTGSTTDNGMVCNVVTDNVIVNMLSPQDASFVYPASACVGGNNPEPTTGPTPSGTYSVDSGASIDPNTGVLNLSTTTAGQTYNITFTSDGTCPGSATQTIEIIDTPDAGIANTPANICNENPGIVDLNTLLSGADANGTWTEVTSTPSTGFSGNQFDGNGQLPGTYTFRYTVSIMGCPDDFTDVMITVEAPIIATITTSDNICNNSNSGNVSTFDFSNLVTAGDTNGTWTDTDLSGVDLSNPANVSFDGIAANTYSFTYTTPANGNCPGQTYTTSILVEDCLCPAITETETYNGCQGDGYEVIVNGNTYNQGTPTGTETMVSFNTGCDSIVTIDLVFATPPNPGTPAMPLAICNENSTNVNLNTLITGADAGGTWTETSTTPSTGFAGNTFDGNGQLAGTYTFRYTVSATNCPDEFTEVTVEVEAPITATITTSDNICNNSNSGNVSTFDFSNLVTAGDTNGTWTDTDLSGVDLSNPANVSFDGIAANTYSFTYTTPANGNCPGQTYTTSILVEDCLCPAITETETYNGCQGDGYEVIVNGNTYNQGTPTGTETMVSFNTGCDSIVTIDLVFAMPPNPGTPTMPLAICNENSTNINLNTLISGADAGGTWTETSTTPSTGFAGNTFDGNGQLAETYTFRYTVSATNCPDEFTEVTVEVEAPITATITTSDNICNNSNSGNVSTFDFSNLVTAGDTNGTWTDTDLSGVDLSNPANVSFDGIAANTYSFTYTTPVNGNCPGQAYTTSILVEDCLCPAITLNETYNGCQGDGYEVIVNGNTYNQGTPTGTETMVSFNTGCDSIVTIDLVFAMPPNPGTPTMPLAICNENSTNINLNTLISGADAGGTWTETSTTPSTGFAGNTFDGNGQLAGTYTFRYTVSATNCPDEFTEVTVEVEAPITATISTSNNICNNSNSGNVSNFNFNSLVTTGATNGTWTDTDLAGVDLSDPANVSFDGITANTYSFTYTTPANGNCPGQTYTTSILVEDCLCPAITLNETYNGCQGDGYEVIVNGNTYNQGTPTGTETMVSFNTGCDSIVTIDLVFATPPNPGTPAMPLAICNENSTNVNLNTLISGADAGGTWTETSTTPSTGFAGNTFDGNGQLAGTYTFRYTVSATNCPDEFTEVTVEIEAPITATISTSNNICNNSNSGNVSNFNFNSLVTTGATNGTWTDTDLAGVDLSDPANVSFNGITANTYSFTYTTPANGNCPGQTYTTSILVEDCLCPAITLNETYNGCQGDGYEVIVNGNTYNQGTPTGTETMVSFNTGCDSIVTIDLVFATPPNAGTAGMPATACNDGGSIINLNSLLTGADPGGTWTETSALPSSGITGNQFDPDGEAIGVYTFRYTVVSSNNCPDDFTEVTVSVEAGNTASLDLLTFVCNSTVNGNITTVDFNTIITAGDATGTWADTEGTGVDLSNLSSVDFSGIALGTYTFTYTTTDAGNCPGQDYEIEILVRDCDCAGSEETITYSGCTGDGFSTVVNGNTYDENTPTGTEVMINQMNCDSTIIIDLSFSPAPTIEAGDDRFACIGDPIDLTASIGGAATTVTWSSTGDGSFDDDQSLTPVYIPGTTDVNNGFVSLIALTDNGGTTCPPATDLFTINFVASLTGSISGENTVCAGESAEISFDLSGGTLYNITYSDGTNTFNEVGVPNGFTVMVNPTTTTTYTLESLTAIDNNCLATIPTSSVTVVVSELSTTAMVTSEFDGFGVSCNGSSDGEIIVTPVLGTAPFTYEWSNGSTSATTDNLGAGFYTITVTDGTGCTEEVSATITEPSSINLTSSTISPECFGDNTGVVSIDTITGGNGPYAYSVDGLPLQVVSGFPVLTPFLEAGNYTVTLQDSEGCETETSVNIAAPNQYIADLGRDTSILLGDSVELEVFFNFDPDSILWTSTFGDACVSCTAQYVMPTTTSSYLVYAADSTGCSTTTEVVVTVDKPRRVYIPNAFSPNGDGTNDLFYISASTEVERITKFSIFDRWGEVVFNADGALPNDPRFGWDGELKNKRLNSAVFVYLIEVLFVDGERKLYSGDVTLVR